MTEQRTPSRNPPGTRQRPAHPAPDQVPQAPRRRPSEERAQMAASARTATQLALLAIVIASAALGLIVWRTFVASSGSAASTACQSTVWRTQPDANNLPAEWQIMGNSFDVNRRTTSMSALGDGTSQPPNVLATLSCLGDSAAEALSRAQASAKDAGQTVTAKDDLSDGGFEAVDPNSGAIFLEFRRGEVLVDLAASGGATQTDIETVASAYDRALGGDGGSIASLEPLPSDSFDTGGSPDASDSGTSHGAPELEKLVPAKIGAYQMSIISDVGSNVLPSFPGEREATAAIKALGKTPDDMHYAEADAVDADQNPVVIVSAMSIAGVDGAKTREVMVDWFGLRGSAVKHADTTLAGKTWTKYDIGDGNEIYYIRTQGEVVFSIAASDPAAAEQAAAAMP